MPVRWQSAVLGRASVGAVALKTLSPVCPDHEPKGHCPVFCAPHPACLPAWPTSAFQNTPSLDHLLPVNHQALGHI